MRLDIYLKQTGLIKKRSEAKRACENQQVILINVEPKKVAKASQSVHIGECFQIELENRLIKIEILRIPIRTPSRKDRARFFRLIDEQHNDSFSDLSF